MLNHCVSIFLLLGLQVLGQQQDSGKFTNPSGTQPLKVVTDNNQIWSIGSTHTIAWTSTYDDYSLDLNQQNLSRFVSNNVGSIYKIQTGGKGSQTYNWQVTTSPNKTSDIADSPVYYFAIVRRNDSALLYTSHYFNITDKPVISSTSSASTSTATATSSGASSSATVTSSSASTTASNLAASSSNGNDSSNKNALKIGLGVGLGVGIPLLLLAIAAGALFGLKLARQKSAAAGKSGGAGDPHHGMDVYGGSTNGEKTPAPPYDRYKHAPGGMMTPVAPQSPPAELEYTGRDPNARYEMS